MPRPQAKNDLIEAADLNYDKLLKLIDSMTEIELSTEFDFSSDIKKKEAHWGRDKNLRDIFIHFQMMNYSGKMHMTEEVVVPLGLTSSV